MASSNPVLAMLKADHKKVKGLFDEYEDATPRKQQDIAQTTIQELDIHAELEERLIYPAIRESIDDNDLMNGQRGAPPRACAHCRIEKAQTE